MSEHQLHRVIIERSKCCGYGLCAALCPEVYKLDAGGIVSSSENIGNGQGGGVRIDATSGGSITTDGMLQMTADGGSFGGFTVATSGGTGDGGNILINADGGSVGASYYYLTANGSSANSAGAAGNGWRSPGRSVACSSCGNA